MGSNKHGRHSHSQDEEDRDDGMSIDETMPKGEQAVRPLDLDAADAIARQLKATYGKLLNEPVPDKFLDLLKQLGGDKAHAKDPSRDKG